MKILNEFGIKPTFNYVAAGADFYIPYFSVDKKDIAFKAFETSYKVSSFDLTNIFNALQYYTKDKGLDMQGLLNTVHLFLALDSTALNYYTTVHEKAKLFSERYLIVDKDGKPGIKMELNDALLINSGIHVALPSGTAGVFLNKSGKGNAGFDVRSQVVDEDYTGFVHCSVAYTKDTEKDYCKVYCGDKLVQMVIVPVVHESYSEVSAEEYYETMRNAQRGQNSFGSSDVQH